jgi:hypothetical protein
MLERSRLSFLSGEVQTSQSQPIIGTPLLVPVPKNVILREGYTGKNKDYEPLAVSFKLLAVSYKPLAKIS